MKKMIYILVAMLSMMTGAKAMTYEQAREQALFLTDKMAYELNLNQEQFEAAYEINLDYLMSINTVGDVYAAAWRQRNLDLQYILYDWQYTAYQAASYFFRPVFWNAGYWHFGIYSHYPHRTHYYFSYPVAYRSYRGAHSWRYNGGRSWYVSRRNHYRPEVHRQQYIGMRDRHADRNHAAPTHRSSTRETVGRPGTNHSGTNHNGNRNFNRQSQGSRPSQIQGQNRNYGNSSSMQSQGNRPSGSSYSGNSSNSRPNSSGFSGRTSSNSRPSSSGFTGRQSGSSFSGSSHSSSGSGRSFSSGGSGRSFSGGSATRSSGSAGSSSGARHGGRR